MCTASNLALPLFLAAAATLQTAIAAAADWPQAAGPSGSFVTAGEAVDSFSRTRGANIRWSRPLPSTGQGAPVISAGHIFVTSHEPIQEDAQYGRDILCLCFDQKTGKERWRRTAPAVRTTDLSSLFSDNTAASPVAANQRVVFVNVGGSIRCFDFEGNEQWSYDWTPFGRHHARLHEPILHGGQVITLQYRYRDLRPEHTTKPGARALGRGRKYWTHFHAFDIRSGKVRWISEAGASIHQTSIMARRSDGVAAILTGRGGGHQPPEEPYGMSLVDSSNGKTLWTLPIAKYPSAQNSCWRDATACAFVGREHWTIDAMTGDVLQKTSLVDNVTMTEFDVHAKHYRTRRQATLPIGKRMLTKNSNLLVGDYHYFRTARGFYIGRVHLPTQRVEYLQAPVQIVRRAGKEDETRWQEAIPNDMKNAQGWVASQDKRNAGNGWGHVSAASPIAVGERMYMPTMLGMVYVIDWDAERLDESALRSISDLGPAGETWSLSSLAYADGCLYARTLKELICIGP